MSAKYLWYDHSFKNAMHIIHSGSWCLLPLQSIPYANMQIVMVCNQSWYITIKDWLPCWMTQAKETSEELMSSYIPRMVPVCCTVLQNPKSFQRYKYKKFHRKSRKYPQAVQHKLATHRSINTRAMLRHPYKLLTFSGALDLQGRFRAWNDELVFGTTSIEQFLT